MFPRNIGSLLAARCSLTDKKIKTTGASPSNQTTAGLPFLDRQGIKSFLPFLPTVRLSTVLVLFSVRTGGG